MYLFFTYHVACYNIWFLGRVTFLSVFLSVDVSVVPKNLQTSYEGGRDLSRDPGFQDPRKSLKLTGNPC